MIDVEKLRKVKGRRIYLFWLDEQTGDITEVTSRDDVVQVIRCKDCKLFNSREYGENEGACWNAEYFNQRNRDDYCSYAERKEE